MWLLGVRAALTATDKLLGVGNMAWWLRVLAAFTDNLGSVPRTQGDSSVL